MITTTATPSLTITQIRNLRVRIPRNLQEQHNICKRINAVDSAIRAEQSLRNKLSVFKSGLMADLLIGRVRVPESASAMENQP